ncbi:MAG: GMC family oxidoreductase [Steroidobacteraceae bacterium]
MDTSYDVVIVGTGFAAAFFLKRYLEKAPPNARVLVLERGGSDTKAWQLANRATSSIPPEDVFVNSTPEKLWLTSPGFGGNSKCWLGGTTRMMPGDFKLKSRYGVGLDWPVSYDDLEELYCTVEEMMLVSGPSETPMPRSRPYPLPPHRFSDPEVMLKKHFPDGWYQVSTARASVPTGKRGVCCSTGYCELCPVDAKFTIQNGLAEPFQDPRVTLQLHCEVNRVEVSGRVAQAVEYTNNRNSQTAKGELIVLAASALFNPHILLRSGIGHRLLGKRLHEQGRLDVMIDLDGVKSYNGSSVLSGLGYLFYEGEHRRDHAACLIETWNSPFVHNAGALRYEQGRWNERMSLGFMFDDIPRDDNIVKVNESNPRLAETVFTDYSDYAKRAMAQFPKMIDKLSEAIPIERIGHSHVGVTSAHIQGTVVMGDDPTDSIVDRHLIHHELRNLVVLGASAFPTASPAYPTLTVSALSLWAADHLFASAP